MRIHNTCVMLAAVTVIVASAAADAKPRRVVVLEFDGPRTAADTGRNAVVSLLTEQYEVVAVKRWEHARAQASRTMHGPHAWKNAAKVSGVDAVIEGWVQNEGRHRLLTIAVREAASGREFDSLSVKLGTGGLGADELDKLRVQLDELLDWIEPGIEPRQSPLPRISPRDLIAPAGNRSADTRDDTMPVDDDDVASDGEKASAGERRPRDPERAMSDAEAENPRLDDRREPGASFASAGRAPRSGVATEGADRAEVAADKRDLVALDEVLGVEPDPWPLPRRARHIPKQTPRVMVGAGGFYGSRNIDWEADGEPQLYNAAGKGLAVNAAVYPFPPVKTDSVLTGVGVSLSVFQSIAGEVGGDTEEQVANYQYNHGGWEGGIHYRHSLGLVVLDGEVGYGRESYVLANDYPLEVPDTEYKYLYAGAHVDLQVTERATIGGGARYLYVMDNGPISDVDWYGPGSSSGYAIDGSFVIPLPASLYVRGALEYRRITTDFDGAGLITEQEGILSAFDSWIQGDVNVGIQF